MVANHGSHADTAALLAALPPASRPVFAAAADYWFDVPARRALASGLAGILPVRRDEHGRVRGAAGGRAARARGGPHGGHLPGGHPQHRRAGRGVPLRRGPAGRRLRGGAGAGAVLGTRDVLPKHGRLRPGADGGADRRPARPETTDAAQLRADVLDLLGRGPARRRTSAVWARVARLVSGPRGLLVAFVWGFAEAPAGR